MKFKKITTFAVTNGAEGSQIVFQYSILNEYGKIIDSGKRDMVVLMGEEEMAAANTLTTFLQNYIDNVDNEA